MDLYGLNECIQNFLNVRIDNTSKRYIKFKIILLNDSQWFGWSLVQIMAYRLFGAKPLSKPMPGYHQLDDTIKNELMYNFNQNTKILFIKMHLKISPAKWRTLCPGEMSLTVYDIVVVLWHKQSYAYFMGKLLYLLRKAQHPSSAVNRLYFEKNIIRIPGHWTVSHIYTHEKLVKCRVQSSGYVNLISWPWCYL